MKCALTDDNLSRRGIHNDGTAVIDGATKAGVIVCGGYALRVYNVTDAAQSGLKPSYFCFQAPPRWYHQPERALSTHCLANTLRICPSHSAWPLATAISR